MNEANVFLLRYILLIFQQLSIISKEEGKFRGGNKIFFFKSLDQNKM